MSPIITDETMLVDRIAIIGAGPCGLAAAKYLAAEKKFSKIQVFEQRATVGGVWNHTPVNVVDKDFSVPRTEPTKLPDTAVWAEGSSSAQFVSPVYDFLETNIPHSLMNYTDLNFPSEASLFPKHSVVNQYLQDYAAEIEGFLSLETQVLGVEKVQSGSRRCWKVELLDLKSGVKRSDEFDAVLVASGHYNDPFIPQIQGLAEFNASYPGSVSHSKFYRRPDQYQGKKVIIVGNSASGIDLSAQISTVSQLPVIVSEKSQAATAAAAAEGEKPALKLVPKIAEFLSAEGERAVRFADGHVERDVDAVVFCTGYFYSFPYLRQATLDPPVTTDGSYVRGLYEHILYAADPTLAFLGMPQRVVPFPIAEAQSAWVARLWAGRLAVPARADMKAWEAELVREKGEGKAVHAMPFPRDVEYINRLHDASLSAKKAEGLDNDGAGKIPPYWGADKAWTRERFPAIKIASRALGDKRHEVRTLKELGFDYSDWKLQKDAEEKTS
ncbi:thiol-specific monooxygenase [Xylariales sp. PMI_506]|nr:thiol-specific monooxygenase [Xylariales sp. PMI_506]